MQPSICFIMHFLFFRGIASRFTKRKSSLSKETQKEDSSSSSISEKYTLVLQIATKVQNTLGGFADTLEKLERFEILSVSLCILYLFCRKFSNPFIHYVWPYFGIALERVKTSFMCYSTRTHQEKFPHCIETRQLIYAASQLTGFYMVKILALKWVILCHESCVFTFESYLFWETMSWF